MGIKLQTIRECFGGVCAWPDCHETENLEFAHRHGYPTIFRKRTRPMGTESKTS